MEEFILRRATQVEAIIGWVKWAKKELSIHPIQIFTHVITHEFQHKGQILTMSRHLGYIPIDTDVIRF